MQANLRKFTQIATPYRHLQPDSHFQKMRRFFQRLIEAGYNAKWTTYTGGHCCWSNFYNPDYKEDGKNIYDWASRIEVKVWQGKPMFLMTTSTGGYGGGNVMEHAKKHFPGFRAEIKETFSLPKFEKVICIFLKILNE